MTCHSRHFTPMATASSSSPSDQRHVNQFFGQRTAIVVLLLSVAFYTLLSLYFPFGHRQMPNKTAMTVTFENNRLLFSQKVLDNEIKFDGTKSGLIAEFSLLWSGEKLTAVQKSAVQSGENHQDVIITWGSAGSLKVTRLPQPDPSVTCYRVLIASTSKDAAAGLCLELPISGYIYGGGAAFDQRWPINGQSMPNQAYVSNDFAELTGAKRSGLWGGFVERLWLSSRGLLLHVDDATPLSVGQLEDKRLCLNLAPNEPVYKGRSIKPNDFFNATVCLADNAKQAYMTAQNWLYKRPSLSPDQRMLSQPVWCTWARHKTKINQLDVEALADDLTRRGYPASQIEIDDRYTINYGDLIWDSSKFPNPVGMAERLNKAGHRITTWIVPFFNRDTLAYTEASNADYLVTNENNNGSASIVWWQGVGGLLDSTNPDAVDWFVNRLDGFRRRYSLKAFKFDAGETYYLRGAATLRQLASPLHFTTAYVEKVAARFGGTVEVRTGYRTQSVPVAVRMFDKDSHWGRRNGLRSIVPNALMLAVSGYHFVMPDMIGGNAYSAETMDGARPDRELYIRWLQLSCFLPILQFSITPWDYDESVSTMALQLLKLRAEVYEPALQLALSDMFKTGAPVTRPLWWLADNSEHQLLWTVDDQFLVGDSLLVAPVLDPGSVARDIVLPAGQWKDGYSGKVVSGPTLLKGHPAPIHVVPHFLRVRSD